MRFLKSRWGRVAVVPVAILLAAFVDHLWNGVPLRVALIKGVVIIGGVSLALRLLQHLDRPKQSRSQATTEPRPPDTEERDASGG